jgi:hypothetical protein
MEHNAKLSKKRSVKKADFDAGFFFIMGVSVGRLIQQRCRQNLSGR